MGLDLHVLVQSLNFPTSHITDGILTNCTRHEWMYAANAAVARKAADDLGNSDYEERRPHAGCRTPVRQGTRPRVVRKGHRLPLLLRYRCHTQIERFRDPSPLHHAADRAPSDLARVPAVEPSPHPSNGGFVVKTFKVRPLRRKDLRQHLANLGYAWPASAEAHPGSATNTLHVCQRTPAARRPAARRPSHADRSE